MSLTLAEFVSKYPFMRDYATANEPQIMAGLNALTSSHMRGSSGHRRSRTVRHSRRPARSHSTHRRTAKRGSRNYMAWVRSHRGKRHSTKK
jgi:hypothetical protein